jgi:hypothetical protein
MVNQAKNLADDALDLPNNKPPGIPSWAWPTPQPETPNNMPWDWFLPGNLITPEQPAVSYQNSGPTNNAQYLIQWDVESLSGGNWNAVSYRDLRYGPVSYHEQITYPFGRYTKEGVYTYRNTPNGSFQTSVYPIESVNNSGNLIRRNGRGSVTRTDGIDPPSIPYSPPEFAPNLNRGADNDPFTPGTRPRLPRPFDIPGFTPGPQPQTQPPIPQPEIEPGTQPQTQPPIPQPEIEPGTQPQTQPPIPQPEIEPGTQPGNPSTMPPVNPIDYPIPVVPQNPTVEPPDNPDNGSGLRPPGQPPPVNPPVIIPGIGIVPGIGAQPYQPPLPAIEKPTAPGFGFVPGPQTGTTTQSPTDRPTATTPATIDETGTTISPTIPPTIPPTNPTSPSGCSPCFAGLTNQLRDTNDDLLAELEKIKRAIGVHGLPASVPDIIAKQNPAQKNIESLAELHLWQVEQLDSVLGRWPQEIPIPTPTGTVNVGMPNVSETMAEMIGMLVSQQVTAAQILNTSSRTLAQAGSATQQAFQAQMMAKANAEFLGYENRPVPVEMPLSYTPGENLFEGFLSESYQKVRSIENTDSQDLKSVLAELLHAAAIIRAVYWRKLDPRSDLRRQIEENLRAQSQFVDDEQERGSTNSAWEAYLRQVEEGFRASTGDTSPYNRNPNEGPQIRDIGTDEPLGG